MRIPASAPSREGAEIASDEHDERVLLNKLRVRWKGKKNQFQFHHWVRKAFSIAQFNVCQFKCFGGRENLPSWLQR